MALQEASRFFRPTTAEYTPQFVEEQYPFDMMLAIAQEDKRKRDVAQGMLMETNVNVNALKEHEPFRQEMYNRYDTRINKLQEMLSRGESPDTVVAALSKINQDWLRDPMRIQLEQSYQNKQDYTNYVRGLGEKYDPIYDQSTKFTGKTETGEFQPFEFESFPRVKQNVRSLLAESTSNITPDATDFENLISTDKMGNMTWRTDQAQSIGVDKIINNANFTVDNALNDERGMYFIDQLFGGQVNYEELDDEKIVANGYELKNVNGQFVAEEKPMTAKQLARNEMKNAIIREGATKMFTRMGRQYDVQTMPEWQVGGGETKNYNWNWTPEGKEYEIKPLLDVKDITPKEWTAGSTYGWAKGAENQPVGYTTFPKLSGEKQQMFIDILKAFNPQVEGMTETYLNSYIDSPEARKIVSDYLNSVQVSIKSPNVDVSMLQDPKDRTNEMASIRTGFGSRSIYDIETGEEVKPGSGKWNSIYEQVGKDNFIPEGTIDYKNHITTVTDNNNFANAKAISVPDKKGVYKHYYVTMNASDMSSPEGQFAINMNKLYQETTRLPKIERPYSYVNDKDKKVTVKVKYEPETMSWHIRLPNPVKGQLVEFDTNILGDIEDRIDNIYDELGATE